MSKQVQDYGPKMNPRYWVDGQGYDTKPEALRAAKAKGVTIAMDERRGKKKPDSLEVKLTIVPWGYQLDYSLWRDKKLVLGGTRCRDYGDDVDPTKVLAKLIRSVHTLDR